jgi:hypothetical protein
VMHRSAWPMPRFTHPVQVPNVRLFRI